MDLGGIADSLENKTILVTGSTGFLAKIFVEKVLRVQPHVKRLFLLLRAADNESATNRLRNDVMGKEMFKVLREKCGMGFDSFIVDKVTPVPGDIAYENLGVMDSGLREEMWREIDVVVNVAATTNFDERYDVALRVNAMGAKHVLDFAKKCVKLKMLLHTSTAYVAGEKEGLILEKGFCMGETLNGTSNLDIDVEMRVADERIKELRAEQVTKEDEKIAMKELGLKRSRLFGWPNTYVFTKALGEMLVGQLRGNLPVVILRPTIILSTFKEPFPGWIEGARTIDSLLIGYGKGKLTCFLGDPESTLDVIPGDMVVNAMIASIVAHSNQPSQFIYHVGSSVRNPVKYSVLEDYGYQHFSKKPYIGKDGIPIMVRRVSFFSSMSSFRRFMTLRYMMPLKGLRMANAAFCEHFQGRYSDLNRKYKFVMRLVELYGPYLFFKGSFDDLNTERLRTAMKNDSKDANMFNFDPKYIEWDDYFMKTHIPGIIKYVMK